jgi:hypothetical protein
MAAIDSPTGVGAFSNGVNIVSSPGLKIAGFPEQRKMSWTMGIYIHGKAQKYFQG